MLECLYVNTITTVTSDYLSRENVYKVVMVPCVIRHVRPTHGVVDTHGCESTEDDKILHLGCENL